MLPTPEDFQDTDEGSNPLPSPGGGHLAALQEQLTAAMMTHKRGEARGILDQIISLSGSEEAKKNLNTLVAGVIAEAQDFERGRGTIQERLSGDTDLPQIQAELDKKIPYWRAFVDEIPGFRHAADGLPAHDNPRLKEKVATLVQMISDGQVTSAAAGWNKVGKPAGATSEVITGILNDLWHLEAQCATKKWPDAGKSLDRLQAVVDQETAKPCAPGLASYLKNTGETVRCELLLAQATAGPGSKIEHTKLIAELQGLHTSLSAHSVSGSTSEQRKMLERLEEMIEQTNSQPPENWKAQGSGVSKVIIASIFAAILATLLIVWKTQDSGPIINGPPIDPKVVPRKFDPTACGSEVDGDVRLRMPNGYNMIFRQINLGKTASIEVTESDGSKGTLRAPFKDPNGNHYFLMSKIEISIGQFSQFMPLPTLASDDDSNLPVNHVTDEEVKKFCEKYSIWLTDNETLDRGPNGRFGQARIPSTAEWEFAARGGDPLQRDLGKLDRFSAYPTGADISEHEWFSGALSSEGKRQPVGTRNPNKAGLHDMLGNVSEMTTRGSPGKRQRRMQGGSFNIARSNITPTLNLDRPALMPAISKPFKQEELGFRIVISTVAEWNEPQ